LIAAVGADSYVEPTKLVVGDYVLARIDQWEASEAISARTAQRYRQLANGQIIPHIGSRLVRS
jgi:exosome complex RNA-binding protein Rrp4